MANQSKVFTQCSTSYEVRQQLQKLARHLLLYPDNPSFEIDEVVNLSALTDISYSDLKQQGRPVYLLSEVCRLLIQIGDKKSLNLCLNLSNKIYAFKCKNNESLTISHLYRGVSQIGLKSGL